MKKHLPFAGGQEPSGLEVFQETVQDLEEPVCALRNQSWAGWIATFPLSFTRCDVGQSASSLSLSFLTCKMGFLLHGVVCGLRAAGPGTCHSPSSQEPRVSAAFGSAWIAGSRTRVWSTGTRIT